MAYDPDRRYASMFMISSYALGAIGGGALGFLAASIRRRQTGED